jgi:predicted nucleic acid-binding protein
MRLFLDANILFSAAKSDGAIRELLMLLVRAGHELCADAYVLEEARRNLALEFPDVIPALDAVIEHATLKSGASKVTFPSALPLPEKDQPVMAAAIRTGCDVLLTGDRTHFGPLYGTSIHGVRILSPAHAARMLL